MEISEAYKALTDPSLHFDGFEGEHRPAPSVTLFIIIIIIMIIMIIIIMIIIYNYDYIHIYIYIYIYIYVCRTFMRYLTVLLRLPKL